MVALNDIEKLKRMLMDDYQLKVFNFKRSQDILISKNFKGEVYCQKGFGVHEDDLNEDPTITKLYEPKLDENIETQMESYLLLWKILQKIKQDSCDSKFQQQLNKQLVLFLSKDIRQLFDQPQEEIDSYNVIPQDVPNLVHYQNIYEQLLSEDRKDSKVDPILSSISLNPKMRIKSLTKKFEDDFEQNRDNSDSFLAPSNKSKSQSFKRMIDNTLLEKNRDSWLKLQKAVQQPIKEGDDVKGQKQSPLDINKIVYWLDSRPIQNNKKGSLELIDRNFRGVTSTKNQDNKLIPPQNITKDFIEIDVSSAMISYRQSQEFNQGFNQQNEEIFLQFSLGQLFSFLFHQNEFILSSGGSQIILTYKLIVVSTEQIELCITLDNQNLNLLKNKNLPKGEANVQMNPNSIQYIYNTIKDQWIDMGEVMLQSQQLTKSIKLNVCYNWKLQEIRENLKYINMKFTNQAQTQSYQILLLNTNMLLWKIEGTLLNINQMQKVTDINFTQNITNLQFKVLKNFFEPFSLNEGLIRESLLKLLLQEFDYFDHQNHQLITFSLRYYKSDTYMAVIIYNKISSSMVMMLYADKKKKNDVPQLELYICYFQYLMKIILLQIEKK